MSVALDPANVVTPTQLEMIALYASGKSFREIGQIKHVAWTTARYQLYQARDNLGAENLTHLCVQLVDARLLVRNGVGYKPVQDERVVGE